VALTALKGTVEAEFTEGEAAEVALPLADLCATPGGARDRQLLLGEAVTVIDRAGGHAFVQAARDGYCGWLSAAALGRPTAPTHRIAAAGSHLYTAAKVQAPETAALSLGARVAVEGTEGAFARTPHGWVPLQHLRSLDDPETDPASVAERLLGTPYLWGGNSRAGIDCSGLVQAAWLACGRPCPGDSDLQRALGRPLGDEPPARGDLIFWKGHVAIVVDPARIIHANGYTMSVAHEGLEEAVARIAEQGTPVLCRRRTD
jgi:cell wall-associated NlpC family hydrolase